MKQDPKKFKGLFRVASSRLFNFDYGSRGVYFITICTERRECYFGEVIKGEVKYSSLGDIAALYWRMIPEYFPFASLGDWVVMPNHIHGILTMADFAGHHNHVSGDAINGVSTFANVLPGGITGKYNPMVYKNISRIIRWYKGRTAYEIRRMAPYFSWQPRFHDRIVRNNEELKKISLYIQDNPKSWEIDRLFVEFTQRGYGMSTI